MSLLGVPNFGVEVAKYLEREQHRRTAVGDNNQRRLNMLKGDTKEVRTVVVQPEPPIEKRVLADAIVAVSKAMTDLQKSGLNREAIVVLVCTEAKISRRDVNSVLDALRILKSRYTTL